MGQRIEKRLFLFLQASNSVVQAGQTDLPLCLVRQLCETEDEDFYQLDAAQQKTSRNFTNNNKKIGIKGTKQLN